LIEKQLGISGDDISGYRVFLMIYSGDNSALAFHAYLLFTNLQPCPDPSSFLSITSVPISLQLNKYSFKFDFHLLALTDDYFIGNSSSEIITACFSIKQIILI
jgi:hypothetical protein